MEALCSLHVRVIYDRILFGTVKQNLGIVKHFGRIYGDKMRIPPTVNFVQSQSELFFLNIIFFNC